MALAPQKRRELLFLLLYSSDFGSCEEVSTVVMEQLAITKKNVREAQEILEKILARRDEVDILIRHHSKSYEFERIPGIERNVLRIGVYEMLFSKEIPPKVAISESIRLARKFATAESATFVNAVMDSLYRTQIEACPDLKKELQLVLHQAHNEELDLSDNSGPGA
ncbi:MAG: transcription antitermination factor NusB [Chlamydiota bacterium]